jgi:hypothetical protein
MVLMTRIHATLRIGTARWLLRDLARSEHDAGVFIRMVDARGASLGSAARWQELTRDVAQDAEIAAAAPDAHAEYVALWRAITQTQEPTLERVPANANN